LLSWLLSVVVGELGMHGTRPSGKGHDRVLAMRAAQRSVTLLNEFRNNTMFVRTAPLAVLDGDTYNGIYHYNGRADTYFHIGQAFGNGMLQLLKKKTQGRPATTANGNNIEVVLQSAVSSYIYIYIFIYIFIIYIYILLIKSLQS
jgi:hypothetical protein